MLGLVGEELWQKFNDRQEQIQTNESIEVNLGSTIRSMYNNLNRVLTAPLSKESTAHDLLKRPEIHYQDLVKLADIECHGDPSISSQVEILVKYSGYIDRQTDEIKKLKKNEQVRLPIDIDYSNIVGLSNEVRQKLLDHRPETIAQASRISGVTPAAISLLLVHLKKLELPHLAS